MLLMNCKFISRTLLILFVVVSILTSCRIAVAVTSDPLSQMRQVVDEILVILRDKSAATPEFRNERRQQVVAVIKRNFDFREMARRSLARHWRTLTDKEQDDFVKLFTEMLKKAYIDKVDHYSDETVVFTRQIIRGNKALVHSNFIKDSIEIPVNYKLIYRNNQWLVYDIIVEGVSFIRNYRTQFHSIIQRETHAGLVRRMQEKIRYAEKTE